MMLHRHFEEQNKKNLTTLKDVSMKEKDEEFVSEIFPPDEASPKRRGRPKKAEN